MSDNPFDSPDVWGEVKLSGRKIQAIVLSIDGAERPYEWQVMKGQGFSGATSSFKGEQIAESIKLVLAAHKKADFKEIVSLRKYIAPLKGKKPPAFKIENGVINFNLITKISIKKIGQPLWNVKGFWTLELEFIEYNPSRIAPTGPADPAKPGAPPTPADAAEKTIANLIKKIGAV